MKSLAAAAVSRPSIVSPELDNRSSALSPAELANSLGVDPFLSVEQICALLTISRPSFYRWVQIGHLPKPEKIGPRRVGMRRSVFLKATSGKQ